MNPGSPPDKKQRMGQAWGVAVGAVSELLAWVALSVYAGRKVDGWLGTEPWLFLVCVLAGISLGLYRLVRQTTIPPKSGA